MSAPNLLEIYVAGEIADISTASSVRIPIKGDMSGEVLDVTTVLGGAIATSDATVTVYNGATSMGTITIATASSAEGDTDNLTPTGTGRYVNDGDWIKLTTDGASTNTVPVGFVITIKR